MNAGLLRTRRNRQTGTVVSVYLADEAGIDVMDGKYAVVCEDHGEILCTTTLADAKRFAPIPAEWCEDCRQAIA